MTSSPVPVYSGKMSMSPRMSAGVAMADVRFRVIVPWTGRPACWSSSRYMWATISFSAKPLAPMVSVFLAGCMVGEAAKAGSTDGTAPAAMAARGTPIKVHLQVGPTPDNDFLTQLTMAYTAGTGPDVTSFPVSWTPDYILANFLRDITAQVESWPDWRRDWYPTMRNAAQVNGHIYFLPREATVYSLFYRKDLLQAHHIPTAQPRTWDDLLAVARAIKRKTGKYALNVPAGVQWGAGTFDEGFIHLMLGSGSPLYDTATRKWVVKSPGLLRVFRFYATIAKEGLLPVTWLNSPNPWVPTKYRAFPRGDLAITTSGTWSWEYDWGARGVAP